MRKKDKNRRRRKRNPSFQKEDLRLHKLINMERGTDKNRQSKRVTTQSTLAFCMTPPLGPRNRVRDMRRREIGHNAECV